MNFGDHHDGLSGTADELNRRTESQRRHALSTATEGMATLHHVTQVPRPEPTQRRPIITLAPSKLHNVRSP